MLLKLGQRQYSPFTTPNSFKQILQYSKQQNVLVLASPKIASRISVSKRPNAEIGPRTPRSVALTIEATEKFFQLGTAWLTTPRRSRSSWSRHSEIQGCHKARRGVADLMTMDPYLPCWVFVSLSKFQNPRNIHLLQSEPELPACLYTRKY